MTNKLPQRPHLLKIIPPFENSIVVKDDQIAWNNPWHFHPEIEVIYCIKGKGTNFIGNSIRMIDEGEILLLGKNLPHTRQRDKEFYTTNADEVPQSIVIQFREEFLGEKFFDIREFTHVRELLQRASRGLKFSGAGGELIVGRLNMIKNLRGTAAIIELLSLLDMMARTEDYTFLNPVNYVSDVHEKGSQKINLVYHYTIEHFREPISLEAVSGLTNHSPAAFCRYFKTRTRKTYFQYLTEVRIAFACEQLMEGNIDVGQVCFSSGFNNLSHFHKQFRKIVGLTPSEYRNRSKKKVPGS
ncbi:MAG: AraC family transcriptional regulator [Chryseolinea sp.]